MTGHKRRHSTIFTLVEMLVVIAIIAILSSMLMPALGKSLGSARDMLCKSNLKQIGISCSLYMNDNKSMVVNSQIAGYVTNASWGWLLGEAGYVEKNGISAWNAVGVFRCPEVSSEYTECHYGSIMADLPELARTWGTRLKRPSQKVFIFDVVPIRETYWKTYSKWNFSNLITNSYIRWKNLRHNQSNSCNLLFGDMHVGTATSIHGLNAYDDNSFLPEATGNPAFTEVYLH